MIVDFLSIRLASVLLSVGIILLLDGQWTAGLVSCGLGGLSFLAGMTIFVVGEIRRGKRK